MEPESSFPYSQVPATCPLGNIHNRYLRYIKYCLYIYSAFVGLDNKLNKIHVTYYVHQNGTTHGKNCLFRITLLHKIETFIQVIVTKT
jgi:hypothetical protein